MSDVFLGEPPQDIKEWIIDHRPQPFWTQFGKWLKSFNTSKLPDVGSYVTVPYKVDPDPNASPVDTEWQILGYNKDIPSRIRYTNGKDEIFVPTMIGNELSAIGEGTPVYSGKENIETIGTLDSVSEEIKVNPGNEINGEGHTYGNNNPYDAPKSVNFDGKDWSFAGYNATIMSKCGLVAKYNGNLYECPQFRSYEKTNQYRNDWKTSEIREWMNGTEAISTQKWYPQSGSATTGTIVGLLGRLTDTNFMGNIIPTVTRTWVHSSWRDGTEDGNGCQHLADKFRLLGVGEVNCKGTNTTNYFPDGGASVDGENKGYDTSRFGDVFNETDIWVSEKTRERKTMKEDGTKGSAYFWWLRSASSGHDYYVGYVRDGGNVYSNYAHNYYAVLPVCLIG